MDEGSEDEPGDDGALAPGDGGEAGWWWWWCFERVEVEVVRRRRTNSASDEKRLDIRTRDAPGTEVQLAPLSIRGERALSIPHPRDCRKRMPFFFHRENASNLSKKKTLTGRPRPCPGSDERRRAEEDGQHHTKVEPRGLVSREVG